jgi:hypothetical protein
VTQEDILQWLVFIPLGLAAFLAIWYVIRFALRDWREEKRQRERGENTKGKK